MKLHFLYVKLWVTLIFLFFLKKKAILFKKKKSRTHNAKVNILLNDKEIILQKRQ